MLNKMLLGVYFIVAPFLINAQIIDNPVWTEKSHANLSVDKIELTKTETIFYLSVNNQLDSGGWFCADKKIYIQSKFGSKEKYNIIRSEGIPICPEKYYFAKAGENLNFKLFFPAVPSYVKKIDLVEDCNESCFFFRNLVLDNELSNEINLFEKAVGDYVKGDKQSALDGFTKIVEECKDKKSFRYGYSLTTIPVIYEDLNKDNLVEEAYLKVLKSPIDDRMLTGNKTESFANFKHKAAIRLSLFLEKSGQTSEAYDMINRVEHEYPFQYDQNSTNAFFNDHYTIVRQKLHLLDLMGYNDGVLQILISESIKTDFGKFPDDLNKQLTNMLIEKYGKETCLNAFNEAFENMSINNKVYPAKVEFDLFGTNCVLKYDGTLTKSRAKKLIKKIPLYLSIKSYQP